MGKLAASDRYLATREEDGTIVLTPTEMTMLANNPIRSRRRRRKREVEPYPADGLCACGCGYAHPPSGRYVGGHSPNARVPARRCECGCGNPTASKKSPYYRGHRPKGRAEQEFWLRSKIVTSGCREWQGGIGRKGYGVLSWEGRTWGAHRLAWKLTHGDPGDRWVLHRCDNPPCVNPEHLFLGDQATNVADQFEKGRSTWGMRHGRAKLTPEQVEEIRRRYVPSSGAGRPDGNKGQLAEEFGVHPKYVYNLWRGRDRTRG